MPIYEYRCESCEDKFEKLVRRATDVMETGCPSCGEKHLNSSIRPSPRAAADRRCGIHPGANAVVAKAACAARPVSAGAINDGLSQDSVPSPLEIESIKRSYSSAGLKCLPLQRPIMHNLSSSGLNNNSCVSASGAFGAREQRARSRRIAKLHDQIQTRIHLA